MSCCRGLVGSGRGRYGELLTVRDRTPDTEGERQTWLIGCDAACLLKPFRCLQECCLLYAAAQEPITVHF